MPGVSSTFFLNRKQSEGMAGTAQKVQLNHIRMSATKQVNLSVKKMTMPFAPDTSDPDSLAGQRDGQLHLPTDDWLTAEKAEKEKRRPDARDLRRALG